MAVKTLLTPLRKGQIPRILRHSPRRHEKAWAYQDDKQRYFLGTFDALDIPTHPTDQYYVVQSSDAGRPDLISYRYYGTPAYYWVILWINGVHDPFETLYPGMLLRIPTRRRLAEYDVRA